VNLIKWANTNENLAATHVTPFTSMDPVSGAVQEMFQPVRELSVAAFCKAPPQEKPIIISIFLLAAIYNYWLTGSFFFSF
jgi:hypothetical protein